MTAVAPYLPENVNDRPPPGATDEPAGDLSKLGALLHSIETSTATRLSQRSLRTVACMKLMLEDLKEDLEGSARARRKSIEVGSKRGIEEPKIELKFERKTELEALIRQGKAEADEYMLRATGWGGDSVPAKCGNFAIGASLITYFFMRPRWLQNGSWQAMVWTTFVGVGFMLVFRVALLERGAFRAAYNAFASVLVAVAIGVVGFVFMFEADEARDLTGGGGLIGAPDVRAYEVTFVVIIMSMAVLLVLMAYWVFVRDRRAQIRILGVMIALAILLTLIHGLYVWAPTLYFTGVIVIVGCGVFVLRRRSLRMAYALVEDDKRKYDELWNQMLTQPDFEGGIKAIASAVDAARAAQCSTNVSDDPHGNAEASKVRLRLERAKQLARSQKPRQVVADLAVLFAQAARLNPHFQACVKGWARDTQHVHQCTVKRRARAIEKLFRSYRGHANRIVDLVRSGIVFETAAEVAECISALHRDPCVLILQIKNRLSPDFNSADSAGYRECRSTPPTFRVQVAEHTCIAF